MENNSTITKISISGLVVIQRPTFSDERGFFREAVRIPELEEAVGVAFAVKQMNHARSSKNTLRGIHAAPWNKLIYVVSGKVQQVVVDLREDSETFGKYESFVIGDDNRSGIFVPAGCGNAYLVLSDDADYTYLTDAEWEPDKEIGVLWKDPKLNIAWQLDEDPVLSKKDSQNPGFK